MEREEREKNAPNEMQKEFGFARKIGEVCRVLEMSKRVRKPREICYKRHKISPIWSPSYRVGKEHHGGKIELSNPPKIRGI